MRTFSSLSIILVGLSLTSCSNPGPPPIKDKVAVAKVTGMITVNGEPAAGVTVFCRPIEKIAETRPQFTSRFWAYTNNEGKFAMRTYAADDGLPVGIYGLNFKWLPTDPAIIAKEGEKDALEGQYASFGKPFKVIKVEANSPQDLGTLDLKVASLKKK